MTYKLIDRKYGRGQPTLAITVPPELAHLVGREFECRVDETGIHYTLKPEAVPAVLPSWADRV